MEVIRPTGYNGPMRILMISKACVVGTYQRKLEEMARLPGVDLRVLVPPGWRDPDRGMLPLERAHVSGYDLRVTPIRFNGHFHLHYYPKIGREIRAFQPDIVHIDEEPYNLATWHALWHARQAGAKTLFFSWQNINRRYPWPVRLAEQWVLRRVDYALMGTPSAAEVWHAKGYTGPCAVIPQFGVDPDLFRPPDRPRSGGTFRVGFVGRLVEEKGGALLLDALAQLDGLWQLDIIGDGPERGVARSPGEDAAHCRSGIVWHAALDADAGFLPGDRRAGCSVAHPRQLERAVRPRDHRGDGVRRAGDRIGQRGDPGRDRRRRVWSCPKGM